MVDKNKALELRLQGKTYKQIAEELDCSEAWCKKNLKEDKQEKQDNLNKCIELSKSKTGITVYQLLGYMMTQEELQDESKQGKAKKEAVIRNTKRKIKEAKGIVRPSWMNSEVSIECFNELLNLVNNLDSRLYEDIEQFIKKFDLPESSYNSVLNALAMSSQIGAMLRGSQASLALVESYHTSAVELDKKNNKALNKVMQRTETIL